MLQNIAIHAAINANRLRKLRCDKAKAI